ncbi:MAG: TSUP family transporter [Negativicutes bacterium]|nr:TSUP family transporter [Negativicutes bacterium]
MIWLFLLSAGLVAAFVDSIAGGGGVISLPALLLAGVPPLLALGTNKLAATMASLTSSAVFISSGRADWQVLGWQIPATAVGAAAGAYTAWLLPPDVLRPIVAGLLVAAAVYAAASRSRPRPVTGWRLTLVMRAVTVGFALLLGFYDGFFGPGVGALLIFAFVACGCDFVRAAANAKILNCTSNVVSLIAFALLGCIDYRYGLAMGVVMIGGAYLGTRVALGSGERLIRPLYLLMALLVAGRQVWGWWQ